MSNDYVDGKLKEIIEKIEDQARIFALNKMFVDTSSIKYMTLTEPELAKMTPEELALAEIRLAAYSFSLQQHANKATAIRNWAERNIKLLVAQYYNTFDKFMPYEARKDSIIVSNEYGERLGAIIADQQLIIDEFSYLAQSVQHASDSFGRFAKVRRKE